MQTNQESTRLAINICSLPFRFLCLSTGIFETLDVATAKATAGSYVLRRMQ